MENSENRAIKILRIIGGVALLIALIPLYEFLIAFPIGLVTTIKLWLNNPDGNLNGVLGVLLADFTLFAIVSLCLYLAYRLLRPRRT